MKTTKKFSIRHFADYHEIVPAKGGKAIELGCFLPDRGYCKEYIPKIEWIDEV